MLITRASEYALLSLVILVKSPSPIDSQVLSKELKISKSFLSKILQFLTKAQILKSFRGANGGFMLARQSNEITILEVINAVEDKGASVMDCSSSKDLKLPKKALAKRQFIKYLNFIVGQRDLSVVLFVMAILAIIIVPLPSSILDLMLTISMSLSVLIILISLYVPKPTDLTTFPTIILIVTLFRLSLNIATTRMILSHGNEGPQAVSQIITSFGEFVVGGNYVIGIVVF